jgi:hypothetical protein
MRQLLNPPAIHGEVKAGRASSVLKQIEKLKTSLSDNRWELAELLSEAHERQYHHEWGFEDFDEYIDQSNFDVSAREARYYIRINNHAKLLAIPRGDLAKVAISKLKEIFTLDPQEHAADIRRLLKLAEKAELREIKDKVRKLKGLSEEEEMTFVNLYVMRSVAEGVIKPAIEEAKLEAGSAQNPDGEYVDISDGRAVEYICTEWMQDAHRVRMQETEDGREETDTYEI